MRMNMALHVPRSTLSMEYVISVDVGFMDKVMAIVIEPLKDLSGIYLGYEQKSNSSCT